MQQWWKKIMDQLVNYAVPFSVPFGIDQRYLTLQIFDFVLCPVKD